MPYEGKVSFILFAGFQHASYAPEALHVMMQQVIPSGNCSRHMFSILRFILIVGVIFYYSPVRQRGEGPDMLDALLAPKKSEPATASAAPAADSSAKLEAMWQALPDGAKQAVIEKILTTSGLTPTPEKPVENKPTDTLRPGDRQSAW